MKIIVTGGAGFIGSNFVYHMLNKYPDHRIICVDCLTYAGNLSTLEEALKNPNFRFCKINICDRDAIFQLFEEEHPDVVVNFAAESHVDRSIENPEVFLDTNIKGTAVLMDACRKYGIQRYHQVLQTRYTEIFLWIARICSLQRRRRFTPAVPTAPPRQLQIFWYRHTTAPTAFRLQSAVALTTTDPIISRRS